MADAITLRIITPESIVLDTTAASVRIPGMDGQMGDMLQHLKELNLEQDTVTVWLSEQGSQLPFGKWM